MKRISTLFVFLFLAAYISQAQPSTQASNILIAPVSAVGSPTQMQFYWTPGTGANKVIVVVSDITSSFTPAINQTYNPNTDFAAGADIGTGSGKSVCVFNNTSSAGTVTVTFTGVTYGNDYTVQIFEYTGAAGAENYNVNLATRNPITYKAFTSTGTWTPPSGVTGALVQTWGGGGGGGANNNGGTGNGGSGGGGGAYSSGVITGLSASAKTITVGGGGAGVSNSLTTNSGGDSWFGPDGNVANALVLAKGGGAGTSNSTVSPTNGGASGSGLPVSGVRVSGGNGSAGEDQAGGGGGSSGGPGLTGAGVGGNNAVDGNGGNATTGGTAGAAVVGGGAGSTGQNEADNSAMPAAAFPGGGGGGTQDSNTSTSSSGGGGLVIVSHSAPGIVSATLNYNTGVLVVTLTEPVSGLADIDETKFHINNTTGTDVVTLADPEATGFSGNTITFTLTEAHRLAALVISGTPGGNGGAVVLDVDAGGVRNAQGNFNVIDDNNPVAETADTTAPTVLSVSSSTANGVYKAGNIIAVTVTFSEVVNVTGTPQIELETNTANQFADYASGTGTATLTFNYTVQAGDGDNGVTDLTEIANTLALNGGTIRDIAGPAGVGNAANLAHPGGSLAILKDIKIDTQAPAIAASGVDAVTADGTYAIGAAISLTVTFNESVTVASGTPTLTLETGTTDRTASYASGSPGTTLTFTYTVQGGDQSPHLDYESTGALVLAGATIRDAAGNNASLTLPATGGAGSLFANSNLVIDGVQPTVTSVSSTKADGTYAVGEVVDINIVFSQAVTVTGTPRITLETGAVDQAVDYTSGSTTNTLTFNYTVLSGESTLDLDYISNAALALNGGTIKRSNGNDAILTLPNPGATNSLGDNKAIVIDAVPPVVTNVASSTGNGSFKAGVDVDITVTFDKVVQVTGTPRIQLETGTTDRFANYLSGDNSNTLTFRYSIQAGDVSSDLEYLSTGALTLNGGDIEDNLANNATLTLPALGGVGSLSANQSIIIDTSAPAAPSSPDLAAADDTGFKNNDNITNLSAGLTLSGTSEANAGIDIYEGASLRGSTTADGSGNWTIDLSFAAGVHSNITAVATDLAGNASIASSALASITVDQTKPTAGAMTFNLNPGGGNPPETITWTFSEDVTNVNNGTGTTLGNFNMTGFTRSPGSYTTIGTPTYNHAAPRRGTIPSSANNSNWDANIQISYSGGNIYDVAGNAMDPIVNQTPGDIDPPLLISGLIFDPNGTGNDRIIFQIGETLSIGNGPVAGFNVSGGPPLTAVYSGAGVTNTITLTANGNVWDQNVTVIYDSGTGTAKDVANNHLTFPSAFPGEPILIKHVAPFGIYSTNANSSAYASADVSDEIVVQFNTSRVPSATPTVNFPGIGAAASVTGSGTGPYVATSPSIVTPTALVEGVAIPFSVTVLETGKSTTTTFTSDGSSVIFDKTAPAQPSIPDLAAADDAGLDNTDNITNVNVNVDISGTAEANSKITLYDGVALVTTFNATPAGIWSYTFPTLSDGVHNLTVTSTDAAGNISTASSILAVTIDTVAPTTGLLSSLVKQNATNPWSTTNGINNVVGTGQSLVYRATFAEGIYNLTTSNFAVSVSGSGLHGGVTGVAQVGTDGTTWDITVSNARVNPFPTNTLTGRFTLAFDANTSTTQLSDIAGNVNTINISSPASFTGTRYYTIVHQQPNANAFNITVTAQTGNSITIQWPSTNTVQTPTHFLVLAKLSTDPPFTDPTDGVFIPNSAMVQNITRSSIPLNTTVTATFTGLASGTSYDFKVYKYTRGDASTDNINYELTSAEPENGVLTTTASLGTMIQNTSAATISSVKNSRANSVAAMQFTIYDDGRDPILPNIMTLQTNGAAQETITFTLRDRLTAGNGALLSGFTTNTGTVATALYIESGTTYLVTLTNTADGDWNSGTTVSYDATVGNAVFVSLGTMQSIVNHPVSVASETVVDMNSSGIFTVPAGVTKVTVEAWGAGGGGAGYSGAALGGGAGGGAYSRSLLTVVPNGTYSVVVGNGGVTTGGTGTTGGSSSFGGSMVIAVGGSGGQCGDICAPAGGGGAGGQAVSGIGDVRFSGGFGGPGVTAVAGGGGGSSAGTASNGFNAGTGAGAVAPSGGGNGGTGVLAGTGGAGIQPGGGGGGSGTGAAGGSGGNGLVRITYSVPLTGGANDWDGDNAPYKFSQLVISQGGANSAALANWNNIIKGVELSDGTANLNSDDNAADVIIGPSTITFQNIPSDDPTDVGYIADANGGESSKVYTLRVWLRDDLSNSLAATVDGQTLAFDLAASDIAYNDLSNGNQKSSRLVTPHPTLQSGAKAIDVVADRLVYRTPGSTAPTNTNPQPQIGVGIPFSSSTAQDPEVYALDANNNLDLDFDKLASNINITNTGGFSQAITAPQFIDGKLALNGFRFTTGSTSVVNTQIVVATTGTPAVTPGTSTDVAPFISTLTTIAAGPTAEAALIPSTTTSLTGSTPQNFDFVLTDDVGANTTTFDNNDALPTILTSVSITQHTDNGAVSGGGDPEFDLWLRSIAGAELSRTGSPTTVLAAVTNTSLDFDLTTLTPAQITNFATITDGGTATFKLRVWLNGPVDASLRSIIDGLDLVFNVDNTGLQVASGSQSSFVAAGNLNSGNNNNQIEVDATQLIFAQDFSGSLTVTPPMPPAANPGIDYLVNTSATTLGYSNPIVEAVDVNGLRDTDYAATVTTSNAGTLPMSNQLTTLSAGIGTFSGGFLYSAVGNGTLTVTTSTVNRTGFVPTATTNGQPINVRTGNATTFDVASTVVSSPIASIVNAAPGFTVLKFRVDDDPAGTPVSENDGNPTLITIVTLSNTSANNTIVDWREAIAGARLEDAGNATKFVDLTPATQIGANTLTFTGIPTTSGELGYIADNATKEYNLRIWLKTNLAGLQNYNRIIDGLKFGFNLLSTNVTTSANGTRFTTALQQPNAANNATTVAVTATQIDIVNPVQPIVPPGPASASLEVPLQVQLEARDVNGNLDLGFNSTITSITNNSGATMQSPKGVNINTGGSDITFGTSAFSGGLYNLPYTTSPSLNGFQFTTGNDNDDVSLDVSAGGISTLTTFGPKYPEIRLRSSFESLLTVDAAFVPVLDIPYESNQNIATAATSFPIAQFKLTDGNGVTPDTDGASTNIDDLTLSVTAASTHNIRALAVYKGSTLVQSKSNAAFSGGSVTFDNLFNDLIAPDGGSVVFTIRASFFDTPGAITDNDPIKLAVTAVTQAGGSQFLGTSPTAPLAGFIGGVNGGAQGATHRIEVLATRLDFTTDPLAYEGINQPLGATPVVQARDVNGVVDLDQHNVDGFISSAVGINNNRFTFSNGILTLTGFQYTSPGIGTLTATSTNAVGGALSSNSGGSNAGDPVDVIHVTATQIAPGSGGVLGTPNIKGGTIGAVIFGFTFDSQHKTATAPALNGFSITFDNPYKVGTTYTLKNFKVFESTSGTFVGSTDIAALTGSIVEVASPNAGLGELDQLNITFGTPRTLFQAGVFRSYFLVADVDVTANISSPQLTPQLIDLGFGDPTNANILVSQGSSAAELYGQTYAFASTRPPQLISSNPFNGQLNVDPALGQIDLVFDVDVFTFDGKAELYDRKYNKLIATLPAMNGLYNGDILNLSPQTVNTLSFKIPSGVVLKPDSLYYLKIAQGSYDPATNQGTGISDEGQNFYGGISYNGTLYFKISSPVPPKMMSTDPNKYFASNSAAVVNCSFDQFGKGFYLVLKHTAAVATPTNAHILNPATYPQFATAYVTHGSFDIQQVSPNLQSVPFSASLTPGETYDVWVFAQNDAQPTPFATSAPYGGTAPYTAGATGPTLKLVVPSVVVGSNKPIIQICPNSEVIVTDPIIIGETGSGDFNGGAQNFNLLLPTGFSFDVGHAPTVTLAGGNFVGTPTVSFVNNTILNVAFTNVGTGSFDNILISGFKIFASSSGSIASITRFAGSGLSTLPDGTVLATLFAKPVEIQEFTNTYTTGNNFSGVGLGGRVINVIPDNFNSPAAVVRLIPTIQPATDFGPSFFSGPGVTNDLLNLTGVALNTAFDVTMTHTDLNGCISNKVEQYLVYDHTAAIPVLGTQACVTNVNFPTGNSPALSSPTLNFNAKAGYFLVELFANIPSKATAASQIMFGTDWQTQVAKIPKVVAINSDYKSYRWDYSHILNAVTESGGAISVNPYNHDVFADTTLNNTPYWKGGSLGLVEFTGRYRNNADLSVEVPFRQEVEIFVPPIPVIEVGQASANAGKTPIFCQNQIGDIIINGFPFATAGVSTGFFVLRDSASNAVIFDAVTKPAGFKDNSNGTANLTPALLFNNYKTIRVEYTYQDNNSPCSGTGVFYLRIAPNPVAAITKSSAITANTPLGTEFCEGVQVNFEGGGSTIATGQISDYLWNFGDATGSSGTNPNTATGQKSSHRYNTSASYTPTLTVRSSFGCASVPQPTTVNVGSIPTPEFIFEGVSTADPILFTNKSTFTSPNDNFARLIWSFDFTKTGGPTQTVTTGFGTAVPNTYTAAGVYTVNLDVTSVIGCKSNVSHNIIVLPHKTPTDVIAYVEDFESTDGGWQTGTLGTAPSSWASGALNKAAIALGASNGSKAWATALTGFYNGRERSALYTPSFDLSSLERPMISFDHFTHLAAGEGVAVEYSTDNKNVADPTKNWVVLGAVNSGVFWYNANGLSSQPGQKNVQGFGWSAEDTKWTESKHVLDAVLGKSKVVFRFALSTLTDVPTKDGFAVDNVRVGNRTRTVLVENFKNLGNNAGKPIIEKTESALLKDFKKGAIGTKLVKMNYHVGFPQQDPFNLDNPQDPSSRALYYNVKATPVVKMDGEGEDGLFSKWGDNKYDVQTLKLANARIDINVSTNLNGSLNADVTITSVAKTLAAQSTILQVAIVEKSVALNGLPQALRDLVKTEEDAFEFVVKKMLPTAAGTRLTQTLADGQKQTFTGFTWTPDRTRLYSTDNLAVVAFIQDEATREVFQAEIKDLGTDPPAVTGLEDGLRIEDVILHPNPADNEVTVRLPRNAVADVDIQMIDQAGRTLQNATLPKGERAVTINVRDLPSSVYLLKLTENGRVTYKRAMVVHRN